MDSETVRYRFTSAEIGQRWIHSGWKCKAWTNPWILEFKKHHYYLIIQFILTLLCARLGFWKSYEWRQTCMPRLVLFLSTVGFVLPYVGTYIGNTVCMYKVRIGVFTLCICRYDSPGFQSRLSSLSHLCGSILSESGWIINVHILSVFFFFYWWRNHSRWIFFLCSQWIHPLFKMSIWFPHIPPLKRSAARDPWHGDIVALTLSQILNPACIDTYSLMLYRQAARFTQPPLPTKRSRACYVTAAMH